MFILLALSATLPHDGRVGEGCAPATRQFYQLIVDLLCSERAVYQLQPGGGAEEREGVVSSKLSRMEHIVSYAKS
ncbi:unnamed protein product [Calypogeia fissa]